MIIHVVRQGETISSIAGFYGKSVERLILENGISDPDDLVVGETLVILHSEIEYTVQGYNESSTRYRLSVADYTSNLNHSKSKLKPSKKMKVTLWLPLRFTISKVCVVSPSDFVNDTSWLL